MIKALLLIIGVALLTALGATPLMAQTELPDPPLFIGNSTCPDSSCTNLFNNETIGVPATSLTVYDQGANKKFTDATIILLVAIPNPGTGAPAISSVAVGGGASGSPVGVLGGGPYFGGTWNSGTGAATANLTATYPSGSGSVYPVAGLPTGSGGASSDNFANFAAWDNGTGLASVNTTTGFFGVFAYSLTGVSLGQGQYLTVNFAGGGLPLGTFVAAFSCETPDDTSTACSGGDIYSTPFTHVGLVDAGPTPEPASMLLIGTGLVAFGGMLRRKKATANTAA